MKKPLQRNRFPRSFYDRSAELVARDLLGAALLRRTNDQWVGGVIVETEAYLSADDPASHSARGKTRSNASMFASPGTLYVYPIHAKHCMNAVTEGDGLGSAVLIRAIEPVWGLEIMKANRSQQDLRRLTRGPAMLCQALRVDRSDDGADLSTSREIYIAGGQFPVSMQIVATPRVGISKAQAEKLRFVIRDNPFVSGKRV